MSNSVSDSKNLKAHEAQVIASKYSIPAKLIAVLTSAVVHSYGLTSQKLAAECLKHQETISALREEGKRAVESLQTALVSANDPESYGNVFKMVDGCKLDRKDLAQKVIAICITSCELSKRILEQLEPEIAKLQDQAIETETKVMNGLMEIGFGVEDMPAAQFRGVGGERFEVAAERQFEHLVRFFNAPVRNARRALKVANDDLSSARRQVSAKEESLEAAKTFLRQLAIESINQ